MIFSYPREFPADAVEQSVSDAAKARALVRRQRPDVIELIDARLHRFAPRLGRYAARTIDRSRDAILIGFCRMALRYGRWSEDFHAYHNETHVLELLGARTERLIDTIGIDALSVGDWFLLAFFAATHDLRQREAPLFEAGIGSNERASAEEAIRILKLCGFTRQRHRATFVGIELMIAGSTFDARPPASMLDYNTAELLVQSRGALARKLERKLDAHVAAWREDTHIVDALKLAQISADLDTANVAEPFADFVASAERLCREREMRSHRDPQAPHSAVPVLDFLTEGQERYFFDLHRFGSEAGRRTFESTKLANAPKLKALVTRLRAHAAARVFRTGEEVIDEFRKIAASIT